MGLHDLYEFDLVVEDPGSEISTVDWLSIQRHLLHRQPAQSVELVGEPPKAIHVVAFGGIEVGSALLQDVSRLARTTLRVQA